MRLPRLLPMPLRPFPIAAASVITMTILCGCIIGGTGTDTENGVAQPDVPTSGSVSARVLDSSGAPLAKVALDLFDPGFRPDSGKAPAAVLSDSAHAPVSDAKGYAKFSLLKPGTYVLEGSLAGQALFFDTLSVPDLKAAVSVVFHARAPKSYKGKVRLASGMRIDSGTVFIRGTRRWVKVDAAGAYDLGMLPQGAERMAIGMRYAASPTAVLQVNQTSVAPQINLDTSKGPIVTAKDTIKYTCRDLVKDSTLKPATPSFSQQISLAAIDTAKVAQAAKDLDTGKVSAALHSCDSVPQGALINVRVADRLGGTGVKMDSVSVPFLVIARDAPAGNLQNVSSEGVVSYDQCVETPGTEKTTYAIQLQPTADGSDLVVGDLAGKCVKP